MENNLSRNILILLLSGIVTLAACGGGGTGGSGGAGATGGAGGEGVTDPPAVPGSLSAVAGEGSVELTWDSAVGADSYNLYWTDDETTPAKTNGAQIVDVTSPYDHEPLTAWLTYKYVVTAVNAVGESDESVVASAIPISSVPLVAPTNVSVVGQSYRNAISWDLVPNATTYNIYWVPGAGDDPSKTYGYKIENAANPFLHGPIANDINYRYVITAKNPAEEGPMSIVVNGTPVPSGEVGEVEISFILCCTFYEMGYALWVEDWEGSYVATVVYYWNYLGWANAVMPEWQNKKGSHVDGVTHASAYSGQTKSHTWDGLDYANQPVPHGRYRIRLIINDWDLLQAYMNLTTVELDLYDEAFTVNEAAAENSNGDQLVNGGIDFTYTP